MDWIGVGIIIATVFSGLAGLGAYIHQARKTDRQREEERRNADKAAIDARLAQMSAEADARWQKVSDQTREDHTAVRAQIADLADTMREHYLSRREADRTDGAMRELLNLLRSDVQALASRFNSWGDRRGSHPDG